jgi:hypothetical protein
MLRAATLFYPCLTAKSLCGYTVGRRIPLRFNGRTRHSFTEHRLGWEAQKWVHRSFGKPCTFRLLS